EGKCSRQFAPADVHVERFGLDVEEIAPQAEVAKLAFAFQGCTVAGNQDVDDAERCKALDQFLGPADVELDGGGVSAEDVDLRPIEAAGKLRRHLAGIVGNGGLELSERTSG